MPAKRGIVWSRRFELTAELTPERLVEVLYETLLLRPADIDGAAAKVTLLEAGRIDAKALIEQILLSDEFRSKVPNFLHHYRADEQAGFTNDVSQYGEIWLLLREMVNTAATNHFVVDVGARGRDRSNSYDLLRYFNWRGLLIEANPGLLDVIRREFAGLDFALVGCAVSDYTGTARFTLGVNDDVSSLNEQATAAWGEVQGSLEVEVRRLSDVLDENNVPAELDLLSIDIEGEDLKVLNDLIDNSAYRPRWVVIEASNDFATRSLQDIPLSPAVRRKYEIFAQTSANLLLRRRG